MVRKYEIERKLLKSFKKLIMFFIYFLLLLFHFRFSIGIFLNFTGRYTNDQKTFWRSYLNHRDSKSVLRTFQF